MRPIETLAIGNELLEGSVLDSNSRYAGNALQDFGLAISRKTVIPDQLGGIVSELESISHRASICIVSGGLGPTTDDLTTEAAALFWGANVVTNESALDRIRVRFEKSRYVFTANNRKDAEVPEGAQVFQNDVGTAPAFSLSKNGCRFFFFPGVPLEYEFFTRYALRPHLETLTSGHFLKLHIFQTLGLGESHADDRLKEFSFPHCTLAYQVESPTLFVKLREIVADQIAHVNSSAIQWVRQALQDHLVSESQDALDKIVHEELIRSHKTLAIAESCTGGLLAEMLTRHPGASQYFLSGHVTYSHESKCRLLETSGEFKDVSESTASLMAEKARTYSNADFGLSITGFAGPEGGTSEDPVGTFYLGLSSKAQTKTLRLWQRGDRQRVRRSAALFALDFLRKELASPND